MYCREFPDLQWLKNQAEKRFDNQMGLGGRLSTKGWPTVILNVQTNKTFRNDIRGPLSLFANLKGVSKVQTGNKTATIHEGFYYLTNHDEYYTLDIDTKSSTETFNVHFGEFWADQAFETITKNPNTFLDEPIFVTPHQRLELHSKLNPKDEVFNQLIEAIQNTAGENLPEQELLYALLVHLIKQDQSIAKAAHRLPALKNSTKQELLKRLHYATDYIYSFHHLDISLDELAEISCLSKFHFLRLFKVAFGKTPHQFITEVKIKKATELLKNQGIEINLIARQLGFQSASSFSRTFYNSTGYYPSQVRR
jgi:AraC family transcriptional regulator